MSPFESPASTEAQGPDDDIALARSRSTAGRAAQRCEREPGQRDGGERSCDLDCDSRRRGRGRPLRGRVPRRPAHRGRARSRRPSRRRWRPGSTCRLASELDRPAARARPSASNPAADERGPRVQRGIVEDEVQRRSRRRERGSRPRPRPSAGRPRSARRARPRRRCRTAAASSRGRRAESRAGHTASQAATAAAATAAASGARALRGAGMPSPPRAVVRSDSSPSQRATATPSRVKRETSTSRRSRQSRYASRSSSLAAGLDEIERGYLDHDEVSARAHADRAGRRPRAGRAAV